jgi:putative acyl-CoA dehydrogenase
MPAHRPFATHDVTNQPRPLRDYNAFESDVVLKEAIAREGGTWANDHLSAYGALVGGEMIALGREANENRPRLKSFDPYGRRIDEVEFHPAYHRVMARGMEYGVHNFSWRNANRTGAHVARAALLYMGYQAEAGSICPLTMTHAAVPALKHAPKIAEEWLPRLMGTAYDARSLPAAEKTACTIGMGMTEKQGGSDVRTNTTRATPRGDGSYEIVGHKFFFSAPMSDAHLILAQADGGIACFLVPRMRADGSRNAIRIERLKDKLGDWSNASSEVEFTAAEGYPIGEEGRGIATILEMVALTRLDCMLGSAGLMRRALVEALNHTGQRRAFGKFLIEQPLMRNVLADLALECEAATAFALRVARAVDAAPRDPQEAAFARIATAIGKYWVCKRAPAHVNEAQECLGGIGYVEDTDLPRLYRQAPLNSIWEGSANVQCLDVLRAVLREPACFAAFEAELDGARGAHAALDRELQHIRSALQDSETLEAQSRRIVERMALALQAATLFKSSDTTIAESFCHARLEGGHGLAFGTLGSDAPIDRLIERAMLH